MHVAVQAFKVLVVHLQARALSQALVHRQAHIQALQAAGVALVHVVVLPIQFPAAHHQALALSQALVHL